MRHDTTTTEPDARAQGSRMFRHFWRYVRTRRLECWGFFLVGLFIGRLFF